ncbi:MAG: HAMP domain-containing histidine kinase [Bacteroidales bacterium]|jgi:signal transduction histidine kinase|nr:HAMP domain-containing histidine kinase [Bacteroidales bacterium]
MNCFKPTSKSRSHINRLLFIAALLIVLLSSLGLQFLIRQISEDERRNVTLWASSIQKKMEMVAYTQNFFVQIEKMDRQRLQVWSEAFPRLAYIDNDDFEYFRRTIEENTAYPCVITYGDGKIFDCMNVDFDCSNMTYMPDSIIRDFLRYPPIEVHYLDYKMRVYYKQSTLFLQLKSMLEELTNSFITEIIDNSASVPVLLVTENEKKVITAGNLEPNRYADSVALKQTLAYMRSQNEPVTITDGFDTFYIFYENSRILTRLMYIPWFFSLALAAFIVSMIWVIRMVRRSENDKLWVGMSRETAHQLGTPISSLVGWIEYLRTKDVDEGSVTEIEKDIEKLKTIADRFSKIGSKPEMSNENVVEAVYKAIAYLQPRLSSKIKFEVNSPVGTVINAQINSKLLEWVIENLSKNATDAIGTNEGRIQIEISEHPKTVILDITDNGKGIAKDNWAIVFDAGYTTKTRGWGLGLALGYRIIHDYHKGKIFIKHSVVDEGTTFRIILNK